MKDATPMDTFARFESVMVNTAGITEMQENVLVDETLAKEKNKRDRDSNSREISPQDKSAPPLRVAGSSVKVAPMRVELTPIPPTIPNAVP